MSRPVTVGDVGPKPPVGKLLRRGCLKRCPRCGGGRIYQGWFKMKDRCPTCGYKFEREPGFFVGAYLINFAVTEGLLFVVIMGYIVWKNANSSAGLLVPILVGLAFAVVAPIVFYPFSRTIWSAIDLAMTPIELDEVLEAEESVVFDEIVAGEVFDEPEPGSEADPTDGDPSSRRG